MQADGETECFCDLWCKEQVLDLIQMYETQLLKKDTNVTNPTKFNPMTDLPRTVILVSNPNQRRIDARTANGEIVIVSVDDFISMGSGATSSMTLDPADLIYFDDDEAAGRVNREVLSDLRRRGLVFQYRYNG